MKFTWTLYRSGATVTVVFMACKYSDLSDLSNRIKCALYKKAREFREKKNTENPPKIVVACHNTYHLMF